MLTTTINSHYMVKCYGEEHNFYKKLKKNEEMNLKTIFKENS